MADAAYAVTGFLGGEISQFAQGRFDRPDYKISLNVCLNAIPAEIGPWTRRPGTAFAGAARGGAKGRVLEWNFQQAAPYTVEYTDGFARFRSGIAWATNNDAQIVSSISTANPAVVTVTTSPATGATVIFTNLGTSCPLLQNRQFTWTHINGTTGSIADALTGATIDGSTLGVASLAAAASMSSIQEVTTPYAAGSWSSLRMVQAEETAFLLQGTTAPQAMTVTPPTAGGNASAVFALNAAVLNDGPYLDPFTNGVMITPNAQVGVISLTLSFPAWSSTTSYSKGAFVTSSSVNYESLVDQNVNNTPVSSPTDWAAVNPGAAINNGAGFLPSDIGRLVRMLSEPSPWLSTSTYATGNVISYNPTGQPGASTYWQSLTSTNLGNIPGSDLKNWELVAPGASLPAISGVAQTAAAAAGPAQWTWGKITSLANFIAGNPNGIAHIGTMTSDGGLAAAFNGSISQNQASSAVFVDVRSGFVATDYCYVGQNYSGCSTTNYKIASATIFPSSDQGILNASTGPGQFGAGVTLTAYLYASNSPPSSATNGTLIGQTSVGALSLSGGSDSQILNTGAITITSTDQTNTYSYVWVAFGLNINANSTVLTMHVNAAQVEFVSATAATSANGVNVEILGPPLLYTTAMSTWRLGAYSGTTGYPTCGCYVGGRLWLGGAIGNRFDACVANGISGGTVNFAPTDQYGGVNDNSAIDYTLNSDGVNPIQWMKPVLQGSSLRGIIMGTQQREWFVFPPTAGGFTPTNIDANSPTEIGGANILPCKTEHTDVFVHRYSVKLMEYFADVFSGKFTAPNLADKAQHISRSGIAELAYQKATTPIIWGRCNDGSLFGITYKRDTLMTSQGPTFYAWHRHALGSGRIVESLCDGPNVGGTLDALTMVTNDTSTNVRHVEVLTDQLDELATIAQQWLLDDAVVPTSTTAIAISNPNFPYGGLQLNGLWHLNGKKATVFAAGLDCGDYTVSNGSIQVPYGDAVSAGTGGGQFTLAFAAAAIAANQVIVGFTYNSDGQLVRPQMPPETGARNGPALGKVRRPHQIAVLFNNVGMSNTIGQAAISFGLRFTKLFPAVVSIGTTKNKSYSYPLNPGQSYSGVWSDSLGSDADEDFDGMVCWRVSRPLPCNISALEPFLRTEDK